MKLAILLSAATFVLGFYCGMQYSSYRRQTNTPIESPTWFKERQHSAGGALRQ